jgi:hypothetical protein
MSYKKVDLKKEAERAKKPAAGYPVNYPPKDAMVERLDKEAKKLRKPAKHIKKKKPASW